VPGSNLDQISSNHEWDFSYFSISPGNCQDKYLRTGYINLLPKSSHTTHDHLLISKSWFTGLSCHAVSPHCATTQKTTSIFITTKTSNLAPSHVTQHSCICPAMVQQVQECKFKFYKGAVLFFLFKINYLTNRFTFLVDQSTKFQDTTLKGTYAPPTSKVWIIATIVCHPFIF